ncbi:SGNH/GDSL hydrolase family protein [Pseudarthrobacter phenanthrenivorans]|uniref:SGNH/GDSL hydrolase family protein n=1 Tax=Pseudarthrobacter phenanthrenivorans TaxID=361575 RepID=A0A3B0G8W2_PSEPS|nr:SGNH/GDSL hydrolase family protein [Pseudarthrobacter phenanthrenivorans]RKO26637.1 SGNH/GDSL hydrolase family protein [Pseudarthrobacter phenanthrenivorans]
MPQPIAALARTRYAAGGVAVVLAMSGAAALSGCSLPAKSALSSPAAGHPAQAGTAGGQTDTLATGPRVLNPVNGRLEAAVPDIGRTVLLIGDSQSEPADGWPRLGLAAAGYKVYFCGRGGTGFVSSNGSTGNYIEALLRGDWLLPSGTPALIVIQGGGNDAAKGASDSQIVHNAERLIAELRERYPGTRIAMIGTLARGESQGGGRRSEVDVLLGSVAQAHDLPFVSVGDWLTRFGLVKDLADSVHMNPAGRQKLGTLLEGRLRELGLERKPTADQSPVLAAGTEAASLSQD